MAVTSVTIGGLEINDGANYAVSADTLTMLEAAGSNEAVMVDMQYRPPVYIRSQPTAKSIELGVFFTNVNALDRKADYDALKAASENTAGLVPLTWTDGATTKTLYVHRETLVPSRWFHRASASLVAPDPDPT